MFWKLLPNVSYIEMLHTAVLQHQTVQAVVLAEFCVCVFVWTKIFLETLARLGQYNEKQ